MRKSAKDYFQIGEVSKILEVAPRTVSKWFDLGKLTGYRLPSTGRQGDEGTRRIHRDSLRQFMNANRIPLPTELREEKIIFLASADNRLGVALIDAVGRAADTMLCLRSARCGVLAGWRYMECKPALVIADATIGRREALTFLGAIRDSASAVCLLGVTNEDETRLEEWGMEDADLFRRPFDPALLVGRVMGLLMPTAANGKKAKAS